VEELVSVSPADPRDEIGRFPVADAAAIGAAVARARDAFPAWRDAGLEKRARFLLRFAALAREREEELARLIAREVGKAIWDARAEARLVATKVEATLEYGLRLVATYEGGAGARATFHPRGVLAVIGPFNFPAHLPNGHLVPALATGNTVVFKPSDLAPAVGAWLGALFAEAGLPPGTVEVVQGRGPAGRTLALHPGIDGVLFTGSFAVGRDLQLSTIDLPGRLLALELGGKNAMIVAADADLEQAVAEAAVSIAASTGQRCSSLSRLFVARKIVDAFSERLVKVLSGLRIGSPLAEETFMGPLVSIAAHEKLEKYRAGARDAGGEVVLRVDPGAPPPFAGPGLVRFPALAQAHPYQREEIFGPEAALYAFDDLDTAIEAANDSDYGLVAAVMSRSRASYERALGRLRVGVLNWNRGTIGASGRLPFGGLFRSGNDRPAGIFSTIYCTFPQAHLESEAGFDPATLPPGVPRP
jgi:succinylglutamic semialdehyde dehydrogenase